MLAPMSFGVLALIVAAGLAGPLLSMGRRALVPVVVGELAAGVAIGVSGGGWLDPAEPTTAFLADVGFAMLMFAAGMHVPIRTPGIGAGLRRGALAAVAAGVLAVPAGFGIAALVGGGDAVIYALLLASGSAAVLLPGLQEARLTADDRALTVMSQVALADVAAIIALPLVLQPDTAGRAALGGLVVASAGLAVFCVARLLHDREVVRRLRKASKRREWALDLRLALLLLFALAWVAQRAGTSILVAGFTVGLLVAAIGGPNRLSKQVIGIAAGFFVPLFFVVLGARLDLRAVFEHPSYLVLAALLIALNVAVHAVAALLTRQGPPAALAATAQLGVPAGVVAIGLADGVITPGQGGAIILAALASIGACTLGVGLLARDAREPGAVPAAARVAKADAPPAE
jgi:Kef-type K+ transport system membrane component KefB